MATDWSALIRLLESRQRRRNVRLKFWADLGKAILQGNASETKHRKARTPRCAVVVADPAAARWIVRGRCREPLGECRVYAASTYGRSRANHFAFARANAEAA